MRTAVVVLFVMLAALAFDHPAARAAGREYTEIQHLDFGTFSIAHNTGSKHITVAPDGSTAYDAGIYADVQAKPARYDLTGLPPNMTITLGTFVAVPPNQGGLRIDNNTTLTLGGAPPFSISNFTCNNPTTDGSGNAMLLIGATLTTDGSGGYYNTGTYNGAIDLTFYLD
jgi:hypothetical protein